jgi:hypothetical protein
MKLDSGFRARVLEQAKTMTTREMGVLHGVPHEVVAEVLRGHGVRAMRRPVMPKREEPVPVQEAPPTWDYRGEDVVFARIARRADLDGMNLRKLSRPRLADLDGV